MHSSDPLDDLSQNGTAYFYLHNILLVQAQQEELVVGIPTPLQKHRFVSWDDYSQTKTVPDHQPVIYMFITKNATLKSYGRTGEKWMGFPLETSTVCPCRSNSGASGLK